MKGPSRRVMIASGGAIVAGAAAAALRPRNQVKGGHPPYFSRLQSALRRAGIAEPTLVIDRQRLEANIAAVRSTLAQTPLALWVVTKSLQALGVLKAVLAGCRTERLMVFNSIMLEEMLRDLPASDVLLGRPLPAILLDQFLRRHAANPASAAHPQWLVDSPERLSQYAAVARARGAQSSPSTPTW